MPLYLEAEDGDPGEEIRVGDSVFDLAHGAGQVIELKEQEAKFVVAFGHRRFVYGTNGVGPFRGRRTLYWSDNGLGIPMKNDVAWNVILEICKASSKVLRKRWRELDKTLN